MITITIDETRLKDMARRLIAALPGSEFELDTPLKHQSALQVASKTLFGKPYEEIKETLLAGNVVSLSGSVSVVMLNYGGEHILTHNGDYISATCAGTDMEIPLHVLMTQGKDLAASHGTTLKVLYLPEILDPEYETDHVIELAKKMGFLSSYPSIFEQFSKMDNGDIDSKVFLDNDFLCYGLNLNYYWALESATKDGNDPYDQVIWTPNRHTTYDVTFGELCRATTQDDGNTWTLNLKDGGSVRIEFSFINTNF